MVEIESIPRRNQVALAILWFAFLAVCGAGALIGFLWVVAVWAAKPAKAEDGYRWVTQRVAHRSCDWADYCSTYYTYRRIRVREYQPQVYSYARRERDDDDTSGRCKDVRRSVGDQHLTIDGAKKAAGDAWAGAVRFHYGEKWMSLDNARGIEYICSRSSIKEGGVTTLGQTLSRCEIRATPCAPVRERDER